MSITDEFLANNERFADEFDPRTLPAGRNAGLFVLACMDARIDPVRVLGLGIGDAHIMRNAGGVVTDDAIRSIAVSQRLLGTSEIMLIHHTDCGMLTFRDDDLKAQIEAECGVRPDFAFEAFTDLDRNIRESIARIEASPFIPIKRSVRGFVYEVETGKLREVTP
jgi:carbonic anhydrase